MIWALIQSFVLHRLGLSWEVSLIDSFISGAILAFFCFDAIAIFYYYQPGRTNRAYRLVFTIGLAILCILSLKWVLGAVFTDDMSYQMFLLKSMPVRFIFSLLILSFVNMLNWMWSNMQEQKEQELRRNEAEQMIKEAELAKLRQQLQPHFLFNSLNSISALAGSKPNEARKMIQQLSDFLRGTLKKDEKQTVSLYEEIEHLKLYLEIEKVRFGHRLQVNMDMEPESMVLQIPPLLMQPIVENAIKFGLYGTTGEIIINISTHSKDSFLYVTVDNPFDQETQGSDSGRGTGFGLSSIQRRLFLLYGRNDLLFTEKKDSIFISTLKIPQ